MTTAKKTSKKTPKKTAKKDSEGKVFVIPKFRQELMDIYIIGTSPLIQHQFSEKAKRQMLDKQQKKTKVGRDIRDPEAEYLASMYKDENDNYAFPSVAFKSAFVSACAQVPDVTKVYARQVLHVNGEFTRIYGKPPRMREDVVRLSGPSRPADLRFRASFDDWWARLRVTLNANTLTPEQVVDLFAIAGFSVGVGEWRPERDGQSGTFRIANAKEQAKLEKLVAAEEKTKAKKTTRKRKSA